MTTAVMGATVVAAAAAVVVLVEMQSLQSSSLSTAKGGSGKSQVKILHRASANREQIGQPNKHVKFITINVYSSDTLKSYTLTLHMNSAFSARTHSERVREREANRDDSSVHTK